MPSKHFYSKPKTIYDGTSLVHLRANSLLLPYSDGSTYVLSLNNKKYCSGNRCLIDLRLNKCLGLWYSSFTFLGLVRELT